MRNVGIVYFRGWMHSWFKTTSHTSYMISQSWNNPNISFVEMSDFLNWKISRIWKKNIDYMESQIFWHQEVERGQNVSRITLFFKRKTTNAEHIAGQCAGLARLGLTLHISPAQQGGFFYETKLLAWRSLTDDALVLNQSFLLQIFSHGTAQQVKEWFSCWRAAVCRGAMLSAALHLTVAISAWAPPPQ